MLAEPPRRRDPTARRLEISALDPAHAAPAIRRTTSPLVLGREVVVSRLAQSQADKELIRSRVRLDELARELGGCELKTRGADDLWACCPFHAEDTPSFHIRPARGLFKCFGCGESGDVFSFVQKIRGLDFRAALEFLAERCGVTLGSLTPEQRQRQVASRRVRETLEAASKVFAAALREGGQPDPWGYMQARGFLAETLALFDVGRVPPDLAARLRGQVSSTDLDRAGFTRAFSGRLSFGIRDPNGMLVGFGARTLVEGERSKYVNTRETEAFNKRALLYGLDRAARSIARHRRVVVMEGYTDVMMAHQQGLPEAVATMGTSLTAEHIQVLRSRARDLVFVFDGDRAGRDAAERAVRLTLAEGIECRVLSLPGGADPCDWFRGRSREDFDELLRAEGRSTVAFLCRRGLDELDPGQPGGRERVASEILELARTIIDPVRRDRVAAEISRECGVDRNALRAAGAGAPGRSDDQRPRGIPAQRRRPVRWEVTYQYVVLSGLVSHEDSDADLRELQRLGALDHDAVVRLWHVARSLGPGVLDPMEWIEAAREQEPELAPALERILFPPPEVVLPRYEEALASLQDSRRSALEKEARLIALTQPDIHADDAALRALDSSLRTSRAQRAETVAGDFDESPVVPAEHAPSEEPTARRNSAIHGQHKELP